MRRKSELTSQYLAGICVNILTASYGAFCGWTSPSLLELQADGSPLESGPMTNNEAGWVSALGCLGGCVGIIFFSWCADKIGRKKCLLLMAIPSLIGWLIIPFSKTTIHLAISRFFGGMAGGGVFMVIPIYITELASDRIRGLLGTFLILSSNFGILIAFILGYFYSYGTTAVMLSILTVLFIICFSFLPDTPVMLMKQNKFEEAKKAFEYYRQGKCTSKELPEPLKAELEKLVADNNENRESDCAVAWRDFNNHQSRKALKIGIALMALNQFSGTFALIVYTATIFQQSGSRLSPNMSAIVVGIIQLLGTYLATMLVERAGRKPLLIISSVGTGMGLLCLGGYILLGTHGYDTASFNWVPLASFSFAIFIACLGIVPLPFVVVSEIMPPRIRNEGSMICMMLVFLFAFLMVKYLPLMSDMMGMHGMLFTFSAVCFIGAAYTVISIPETRGKSIDAILSVL